MRPLIGLNTTLMDMDAPLRSKALCHLAYIDAVAGAGGIPIVIPPYTDMTMLEQALEPLDGFCLIGGPDYLPSHYGGHAQPASDLMHERRHNFDIALADILLRRKQTPVLGVCGGHQLINIVLGGGLVQDLRTEWKPRDQDASTLLHADGERKGTPQEGEVYRHEVRLQAGSRIAKIVGATKVLTNSYHHQAVQPERVGEGLAVTAWAPDGVIEAIESKNPERFLLGIQWHPERQQNDSPHKAIFQALVAAAGGV
ncbi:MAG TPA: gamma-glutamyl-gamma-aminobutyrate hydrolase family protein [Planctomycetota bacterium]|nr:gamma-glutamyl-gamma-aminobutyrate hydrolase family protein [Planctomycetota bacterium]